MARMMRLDAGAVRSLTAMTGGPPPVDDDVEDEVDGRGAPPEAADEADAEVAEVEKAEADGAEVAEAEPEPEPEPEDELAERLQAAEKELSETKASLKALVAKDDRKSQRRRSNLEKQLQTPRLIVFGALIAVAVISVLVFYDRADGFHPTDAYAVAGVAAATVFVLVALGILEAYRVNEGGFFSFVIGGDGRLSTSLTQSAAWTFLLAGAFVYFLVRISFGPHGAATTLESLDESYLILL
jgi:hypothetical protein